MRHRVRSIFGYDEKRRCVSQHPEPVSIAECIIIPQFDSPAAGILDISSTSPTVLSSGSFSLLGCASDGGEWAAPAWRPPLHSSGDGESINNSSVQRGISIAQALAVILQPPLWLCVSEDGPLKWPSELLEFQKTGVRMLIERDSVLLADDMGLGKTIQAVAALRLLVRRGEIERVLVVAPAAVLRNWISELQRWAPELRSIEVSGTQTQRIWKWDARVHVKVVSYETLRVDAGRALRRHGRWDLVCLDEAQKIKNAGSAVSGIVKNIQSSRRWALTGTPLENSLDDVHSIIAFLQPNKPISDIRRALGQLQLRRRKIDVLPNLPPKRVSEIFLPLTCHQREEYNLLLGIGVDELRQKGSQVTVTDVLALITHLKQVCNFSSNGRSSKMDEIADRLTTLCQEDHKALIFSQFTNDTYGVRRIARALEALHPIIYTGDMSAEQRRQAIKTFDADPNARVMLLSLKAGGVGLNLQNASYIFHFDRWWNPASEAQADGRSHRIGQTRGVSVYKYICEDTIEERIHEILLSKRELFDEYVDDACMDTGNQLTQEDLFGLFGLSR